MLHPITFKNKSYTLKELVISIESHASQYTQGYVAIQFLQMRLDSSYSDLKLGRRIDEK